MGMPFPAGFVFKISQLRLSNDEGNYIPLQMKKLAEWPDGSIKWALIDFFVSLKRSKRVQYELVKSDEYDNLPVKMPVTLRIEKKAEGIEKFYEIGPGRVLTGLMKRTNRRTKVINISTSESLQQFLDSVG